MKDLVLYDCLGEEVIKYYNLRNLEEDYLARGALHNGENFDSSELEELIQNF
ncbi:MAG: hypothetical protein U9Q99_03255 [Nanoarchaeota archaeon]|nr:hypothetical protein [Nanoarchaeota archaeon]